MLNKAVKGLANIQAIFFPNYLPEKNHGAPSQNFEKKNVLYEKGDEITRFDGI
jgi:hypothetical protein